MTKKNPTTNKALIEEFAKHSREYHNSNEEFTRGNSSKDTGEDTISTVIAKLDKMEEKITIFGGSIHDRCRACGGPILSLIHI